MDHDDSVIAHKKAVIFNTLPFGMENANVLVEASVVEHLVARRATVYTRRHVYFLKVSPCFMLDCFATEKTDVASRTLLQLRLHKGPQNLFAAAAGI
jgi:hypothetical protein